MDDIVIIGNEQYKIYQLKEHLCSHFQTKDLEKLKYILGVELDQLNDEIIISHKQYALDKLKETSMLYNKPIGSIMDPNVKSLHSQGSLILINKDIKYQL